MKYMLMAYVANFDPTDFPITFTWSPQAGIPLTTTIVETDERQLVPLFDSALCQVGQVTAKPAGNADGATFVFDTVLASTTYIAPPPATQSKYIRIVVRQEPFTEGNPTEG